MTRVCVLIRSLAGGGAEKQALLLAKALGPEHEVDLVVLSREPREPQHVEFLRSNGIREVVLPGGRLRSAVSFYRRAKRERYAVAFCFLPSDTLLGGLVGKLAGIPRVFGGLRNTRIKRRKELVLRFLHNWVLDYTVANSYSAARRFVSRGFSGAKMLVVPNGILPAPDPPAAEADPPGELRLCSVGRLVPQKDYPTALRALSIARERSPVPLRLEIVGHGPLERELRALIADMGLEEVVRIAPPETRPAAVLARSEVFLLTSRHEGTSNALMEAMDHGLAVIATDVGDNARLVQDGVSGRIVGVGDAGAVADEILRLAAEPELRRRYGSASRARLRERYSFDTFRRTYLGLVEGSVDRAQPSLA